MLAGELGLSPIEIGGVFAFQSAISVFGSAPATFAIERIGAERILAPALGLTAASMAVFPMAGDLFQASAVIFSWSLGRSVLNPAPIVHAADSSAPEARSQTIALLRTTGDLGFMVGAASVGILGSIVGASAAMQSTAAVSCMTVAWYALRKICK